MDVWNPWWWVRYMWSNWSCRSCCGCARLLEVWLKFQSWEWRSWSSRCRRIRLRMWWGRLLFVRRWRIGCMFWEYLGYTLMSREQRGIMRGGGFEGKALCLTLKYFRESQYWELSIFVQSSTLAVYIYLLFRTIRMELRWNSVMGRILYIQARNWAVRHWKKCSGLPHNIYWRREVTLWRPRQLWFQHCIW